MNFINIYKTNWEENPKRFSPRAQLEIKIKNEGDITVSRISQNSFQHFVSRLCRFFHLNKLEKKLYTVVLLAEFNPSIEQKFFLNLEYKREGGLSFKEKKEIEKIILESKVPNFKLNILQSKITNYIKHLNFFSPKEALKFLPNPNPIEQINSEPQPVPSKEEVFEKNEQEVETSTKEDIPHVPNEEVPENTPQPQETNPIEQINSEPQPVTSKEEVFEKNEQEVETSTKEEEFSNNSTNEQTYNAPGQNQAIDVVQEIEVENLSLEHAPSTENYSEILANKYYKKVMKKEFSYELATQLEHLIYDGIFLHAAENNKKTLLYNIKELEKKGYPNFSLIIESAKVIADEANNEELLEALISQYPSKTNPFSFQRVKGLPAPTTKQLFHIHGNAFGENNNSLEGSNPLIPLSYLKTYLEKRKEQIHSIDEIPEELLIEIQEAYQMASASNDEFIPLFQSQVKEAFEHNRPFLIPGGWSGLPIGHTIYCEVIPESDTTATFRLYNLGEGSNYNFHAQIGNKIKALPYCDFKGIAKEKFLNKEILKSFQEINEQFLFPDSNKKTDFNKKDLYIGFKALLEPQEVSTSITTNDPSILEKLVPHLKTTQSAGICAWRSLMAFMATKMTKESYKQLVCDIHLQSLADYVSSIGSRTLEKNEWRLINKSLQKLNRKVSKAYEAQILGKSYLMKTVSQSKKIAEFLAEKKKEVFRSLPREEEAIKDIKPNLEFLSQQIEPLYKKTALLIRQTSSYYYESLKNFPTKDLAADVSSILHLCEEAVQKGAYQDLYVGLIHLLPKLPLDLESWSKASPLSIDKTKHLVIQLAKISKLFFEACCYLPQAGIVHPERYYFFVKILHFQNHLSKVIDPQNFNEGWGLYKIFTYMHIFSFKFQDSQQNKEYHQIFSNLPNSSYQYYFYPSSKIGESSLISFSKDGQQKEDIRRTFPLEEALLAQADPKYLEMNAASQKARLLGSDLLPDWFKGMRDTQFYFLHLNNEPMGAPPTGRIDTSLIFNYEDKKFESNLYFSIKGISNELLEQHSELKEVREKTNSFLSHRLDYRPFSSLQLTKLIEYLADKMEDSLHREYREYHEKYLLADHAKNSSTDLSEESFKELVHLFLEDGIKISETFEYFHKYPQKLRDPDFQVIFQIIFFKDNLLQKALKIPGFSENLTDFIQNQINLSLNEHETQTAVFLLRMKRLITAFYSSNPSLTAPLDTLRKLLKNEFLAPEERSVVWAELIAIFSKKDSLEKHEIREILVGSAYLNQHPVHEKWMCLNTNKEVQEVLIIHAHTLKQSLLVNTKPNELLLNAVAQEILGKGDYQWKTEKASHAFASTDGTLIYYPLEAKFISFNEMTILPLEVNEHPHYRQLFSNDQKVKYNANGVYEFITPQGLKTLLMLDQKRQLRIEQKREGKWYRFVPRETFSGTHSCALISRHLQQNFNHWQSIDTPSEILAISPKSEKVVYYVGFKGNQIEEIIQKQNGYKLTTPFQALSQFEHPLYIQTWQDDKETIQKIELPRFKLSFSRDSHPPHNFYCDTFKNEGFYLSGQNNYEPLGSFSHCLILRNDAGKKKILIPQQWFESPKNEKGEIGGKEALAPLFTIDEQTTPGENSKQHYYAYDVEKNGELKVKSKEANLYLSYVLTTVQEYELAAKYLKNHGRKLTAYSSQEEKILSEILNLQKITGDADANGHALRVFAGYLLLRRKTESHEKIDKKILDNIEIQFNNYLSLYSNATCLRLEKEEEVFLLKTLLSKRYNTQFFIRLKELDPSYAAQYKIPLTEKNQKIQKIQTFQELLGQNWFSKNLPHSRSSLDPSKILLTRINHHISENFYAFYDLAKNGSLKEKEFLKTPLSFSQHQNNKEWGALIGCIFENPNEFPPFPALKSDLASWWKSVLIKADELGSEKLQAIFNAQNETLPPQELTPPKFKLNPPSLDSPKFSISYDFKAVPTFNSFCVDKQIFHVETSTPNTEDDNTLLEWLTAELKNPEKTDDIYETEIKRLQEDLKTHKQNSQKTIYSLKKQSLESLEHILEAGKIKAADKLKLLEFEILDLANHLSQNPTEALREQLKKTGGMRKVLTLEELFVHFAKNNPQALFQRNPALTNDDLETLFAKIGTYLTLATHEQQRNRAQDIFINVKKSHGVEQKDHVQLLAQELQTIRSYDPKAHPAYLVFEFYANLMIRPIQIQKLEAFLKGGEPNLVMELIMGSGKSKVLLPLLGLLRADGKSISTLIVPKTLFESVASDTQAVLHNMFAQQLQTFEFNRNTSVTELSLSTILDNLKSIKKNRECLILTNKSIQCLLLKYVELYFFNHDKEISNTLQLMEEIINLLRKAGNPLMDEADTILNVLHEVCFSLGEKKAPNPEEIQVLSTIFDIIYNDPLIKKTTHMDSDPNPQAGSQILTDTLYNQNVKNRLAEQFLERLKTMKFESAEMTKQLQTFFKTRTSQQQLLLKHYLMHHQKTAEAAQAYYNTLPEKIQNILALAGQQISHFLPRTLVRNCEEKYGLDKKNQGTIPIPYAAADTPNYGSQFANPHITMSYTFQYYQKKGISVEILKKELQRLQGEALKEMQEKGAETTLQETQVWARFLKLKGDLDIPFNCKDKYIEKLRDHINSSSERKRDFVTHIILPQIELFDDKLSCNSHHFIDLFMKACGFTGTLWNSKSMHAKLQPKAEIGTDAKTVEILWKHSRDEVFTLFQGSPNKILQQLEDQKIDYDLISDAGGYFKDGSNEEVAKLIGQRKNNPVVFYNNRNEQTELAGNKAIPLTESTTPCEKRTTYLDQAHTIGADVKQKRNAIALVTIANNMLFRDLLQSVWRLRELDQSQRIKFIISHEVESIIRQTLKMQPEALIRFDHIFKFTLFNQTKQQGSDNFKALRQELKALPQFIMLEVMLGTQFTSEEKKKTVALLKGEWLKSTKKEPRELYGMILKTVKSSDVIKEDEKRMRNQIEQIHEALPFLNKKGLLKSAAQNRISEIIERLKNFLPASILDAPKDSDSDQTVETEQHTQTETQTQLEVQEHSQTKHVQLGLIKLYDLEKTSFSPALLQKSDRKKIPYFSLESYCPHDPALKKFSKSFAGIYLAANVLEWEKDDPTNFKLLGNHRTPLHFVQVKSNGEIVVLNQWEASLLSMLSKNDQLYNLTFGFYDKNRKVSDELLAKIVKVKFLNGDSSFNTKELKLLKKWIQEQGPEKMLNFFQKDILSGFPEKAAQYSESQLRKLFTDLL